MMAMNGWMKRVMGTVAMLGSMAAMAQCPIERPNPMNVFMQGYRACGVNVKSDPNQGTWYLSTEARDRDGDGTVDGWYDKESNLTWSSFNMYAYFPNNFGEGQGHMTMEQLAAGGTAGMFHEVEGNRTGLLGDPTATESQLNGWRSVKMGARQESGLLLDGFGMDADNEVAVLFQKTFGNKKGDEVTNLGFWGIERISHVFFAQDGALIPDKVWFYDVKNQTLNFDKMPNPNIHQALMLYVHEGDVFGASAKLEYDENWFTMNGLSVPTDSIGVSSGVPSVPVPEPESWLLMALGLGLLGVRKSQVKKVTAVK